MFVRLITVPLFLSFLFNGALAENIPYFQQDVYFAIYVRLNDKTHELSAFETIEYVNNSPDTLYEIYMHLWPNAYKNNNTALAKQLLENGRTNFYYSADNDRGFIDSLDFKIDGQKTGWVFSPEHNDIAILKLPAPLPPGNKITITTPFHVKIPKGVFSRLGHIGQQYQISQWYPKPAVYDKFGWHPIPYLDQGEFYSEFGIFDVYLTLPKNYVVGATGDLSEVSYSDNPAVNAFENEKEWLDAKINETIEKINDRKPVDLLEKKKREFRISIGGGSKKDDEIAKLKFPPSDSVFKTLHFHQEKVHDFAWFADKRYLVMKGNVILPHSGDTVEARILFTVENMETWKYGLRYVKDAVYYYSLWNGDYPYRHATAVDGALSAGGGMEYPNITVIGGVGDTSSLENVIMHEVGHNWFYGILGSNERDHAWMDEGLNSFNELRYLYTKYPGRKLLGKNAGKKFAKRYDLTRLKQKAQYELFYYINARRNLDQPLDMTSADFTLINYVGIVYSKTALIFDYLKAYLGDSLFDRCMSEYYERWKFHHPYPEDLKEILNECSGKDLNWLFDGLIDSPAKIDYRLSSLKKTACSSNDRNICFDAVVKNKGDIPSPLNISALKDDTVIASQWFDGFSGKRKFGISFPPCDKIKIDGPGEMPEINRKNNTIKTHGILRKMEPVRFQHILSLENPGKTQIFYSMASGWNNYDKLMLGMAFYSGLLPYNKFEYAFFPMFSPSTKSIVGSGTAGYTFLPDGSLFQSVHVGISGRRYHYLQSGATYLSYYKLTPEISFDFKKSRPRSKVSQSLKVRNVNISEQSVSYYYDTSGAIFSKYIYPHRYYVNDIVYSFSNIRFIHPYGFNINFQQGEKFIRVSAEATGRITYKGKRGLDIRIFGGAFLFNEDFSRRYGFSLSGRNDYLYDQVFLGRSETSGWLSKQFAVTDGGFKSDMNRIPTTRWLTTINLKSSTVKKIPLYIFADGGYISELGRFAFDAGMMLSLVPGMVEVYFPLLVMSPLTMKWNYTPDIRFTFNINKLNPFEIARTIQM